MESGSTRPRATVRRFLEMKRAGERIVALTAYDVLFARIVAASDVDFILVGDSLGQVVLGYGTTLPVTLEEMIHHAAAVRRGAPDTFIVVDLPFMSFQISCDEAVRNAGRVLKETGAQAVKLEGGDEHTARTVDRLVRTGIPVLGHVGLVPQSVHALSGYTVQGREQQEGERIIREARALEEAGAFGVVLELMPAELAADITACLAVPTIGIGAGVGCDGQVLVLPDALGLNPEFRPRHVKRFADLHTEAREGIDRYVREVREGTYPGREHTFSRSDDRETT